MDGVTTTAALGSGFINVPAAGGGPSASRTGAPGLLNATLDPTLFAGILQIAAFESVAPRPPEQMVEPPQRENRRPEDEDDGSDRSDRNADAERPSDAPHPRESLVELVVGGNQMGPEQLVLPSPGASASEKAAEEAAPTAAATEDLQKAAKSTGNGSAASEANVVGQQQSPKAGAPLPTADLQALETEGDPSQGEPSSEGQPDEMLRAQQATRGTEKSAAASVVSASSEAVAPATEQQSTAENEAEELTAEEPAVAEAEGEDGASGRSGRRERGDDGEHDARHGAAAQANANTSATSSGSAGPTTPASRAAIVEPPTGGSPESPAGELPTPTDVQTPNVRAAQSAVAVANATSPTPLGGGAKAGVNTTVGESTAAGVQRSEPSSGAAANGAAKPGKGESGVSTVDRARLVMRVARAFQRLDGSGGTVRLRLHPAELGSVRVEVTLNKRHMRARLVTETEHARSVLAENLPALRTRLAEQGIHVESVDVEVDSGDLGSDQRSAEDHTRQQQEDLSRPSATLRRSRITGRQATAENTVPSHPVLWRQQPTGGIDIRL